MPKKDLAFKERSRIPAAERERQSLPVNGLRKSRVVYKNQKVDPIGQAYIKVLREHHDTRKIYDVDPFAEVYQFRPNVYGIYCESADGHGDVWCYLIIGPEKCMLVDTAFGIGNLKGLVDELTGGMPIVVVNTHSHPDHAFGDFQFDEVYLHEYEAPFMSAQDEHLWDYLFSDDGEPIWYEFRREDLIGFRQISFIGVPDGYHFDLGGGYEIELIHLGGHTVGSAAFLDRQNRILFSGDDIGVGMGFGALKPGMEHPECVTVAGFAEKIDMLCKRAGEFDYVFPQHGIVDMENICVACLAEALHESIAHPTGGNGLTLADEKYRPCIRTAGGIQIGYHPDQVKI